MNNKVFILYSAEDAERNGFLIDKYVSACASQGFEARLLLTDGGGAETRIAEAGGAAFVINRTRDAGLASVIRAMGVPVSNPPELTRVANDKLLTHRLLGGVVAMMPTVRALDFAAGLAPCCGFPFVIKPVDGHGGSGVELVAGGEEFQKYRAAHDISRCIIQPLAEGVGRDMRVYVIAGRPVAAMQRISEGDFRSNYCLGGKAEIVPLGALKKDELDIVEAVCAALPIDYAGVDIMRDGGRAVLNEIEDPVGARMLYTYTDLDPAALHAEHIIGRL